MESISVFHLILLKFQAECKLAAGDSPRGCKLDVHSRWAIWKFLTDIPPGIPADCVL